MEFLVFWLGTVIASFGMEIANELRMFKDAADAGYKINVKRLSELQKQLNPDATQTTLLTMLIPLFNMMQVCQRTMQYNNARPMILDQLRIMDTLEEMSEIEKEEYLKNPTGFNALAVPLKLETELAKAITFKINNENGHSEFYFKIEKSLDDITILKVTGPASKLTIEEQKELLIENLKKAFQREMEKNKDGEFSIDTLTSIDLSDNTDTKSVELPTSTTIQNLSIKKQKQALEDLKSELLKEKEATQPTQRDKNPTLSRKK